MPFTNGTCSCKYYIQKGICEVRVEKQSSPSKHSSTSSLIMPMGYHFHVDISQSFISELYLTLLSHC